MVQWQADDDDDDEEEITTMVKNGWVMAYKWRLLPFHLIKTTFTFHANGANIFVVMLMVIKRVKDASSIVYRIQAVKRQTARDEEDDICIASVSMQVRSSDSG